MSDKKKTSPVFKISAAVLLVTYCALCVFLYYKFMGWTEGAVYESDLPAHISLAVDDGLIYSLISFIIIGLSKAGTLELLPILLGLFAALSVFFTAELLIEVSDKKIDSNIAILLALLLNIVMPCYIRGLSDGRYMGMHASSIWHNSTYLMMKWMGLWTILVYLRIEKDIAGKLTTKSYLFFTCILTLTTAAKPNFFLAVTPAMLIFLIVDLITKRAPFGKLVFFATSVVPSFAVMVLQNNALFRAGAGGNGIMIAPGKAMSAHTGYLLVVSFLSIAFPLMMLLLHIKEIFKNRYLLFAWLCAGTGYMEYFLFSEKGSRNMDANFSWGYAFTIILIFGIALIMWINDLKSFKTCKSIVKKVYLAGCGAVLAYHTWCGLLFFVRLCMGVSYMMWG